MEKVYKYKNAMIKISISEDNNLNNLKISTEKFIKKVLKEKYKNGNSNSSRNIRKE